MTGVHRFGVAANAAANACYRGAKRESLARLSLTGFDQPWETFAEVRDLFLSGVKSASLYVAAAK